MSKPKNLRREVFPGEKLAVIEEYNDGLGSYKDDWTVRSTELGKTRLNMEQRAIEVEKVTKNLIIPREGAQIIAETGSVTRRDARLDIIRIGDKNLSRTYASVLHVNEISKEYSRNMEMALRKSDIIKAVIVNTKNRIIQLGMQPPEYGVVYAYCSRCGGLMENQKGRLMCIRCNRTERRQIARSYGREDIT